VYNKCLKNTVIERWQKRDRKRDNQFKQFKKSGSDYAGKKKISFAGKIGGNFLTGFKENKL
jgi:hypothetical protein